MLGAFCGGMALNTAGTAIAHAIQSPIGGLTHTAHGLGVGALLPYVMRYNLPVRVEVFAELAELLGVADPTEGELANAKRAIVRVEELLAALGVPADLAALGLTEDLIDQVAEQSLLSTRLIANNARPLELADAVEILRRGLTGDRGWWSR
jgi:alcohol dehydrogenase class IV